MSTVLWFLLLILVAILLGAWWIKRKFFKAKKVSKRSQLDAVLFSGPAGVGKGTIIEMLMKENPGHFQFCVSHTSREKRAGEVEGRDYFFVSKEKFETMIKNGEFFEFSEVHGHFYGTSKLALKNVINSGKVAIIEIDVKGTLQFKEQIKKTKYSVAYIFITAPKDALRERMVKRGKDTPEQMDRRLQTAEEEENFVEEHEEMYDRVIQNINLEVTYGRIKKILALFGGL